MNGGKVPPPPVIPPAPQRMPARFADATRARQVALAFDLRRLPAEYYANPYPTYHALREYSPVHRLPDGGYFVSRYADCVALYKDTSAFSSDKKREFAPKYGQSLLYDHHTTSLVFNDPPLHTRVRRIIAGAFTPRAIADMEAPVTRLVDGLIEAMAAKGSADLIADFAAAVPAEVIGNLLGVPREERGPLRAWSLAILSALEPVLSDAQRERGEQAVAGFLNYLVGLVADRRAHPGGPAPRWAHPADRGRERRGSPFRAGAHAQRHLHPQRRPRNYDQLDRQRAVRTARVARRKSAPVGRAHADPFCRGRAVAL